MNKRFIEYYCGQKDWWRNLDNLCINYRHCGEENSMYLIHMSGKCRIDRLGGISKVWGCKL